MSINEHDGIKPELREIIGHQESGNGTSGSVANGASTTVTISHAKLNIAGLPEVTVSTAGCTGKVVVDDTLVSDSFTIQLTNNSGGATTIDYSWTRDGVKY